MKIGILTLPANWNYGGLLQCYALKTTLESMGHSVTIINRRKNRKGAFQALPVLFKWEMIRLFYKIPFLRFIPLFAVESFKRKNINDITGNIFSDKKLNKAFNKLNLDAIVVGSDQVWNINSAPHIENYFLDFTEDRKVIRLAYAASFGKSEWFYPKETTENCARLIKNFNAISVRESSGVKLCSEYLKTEAQHLVDPTLLLTKTHYSQLLQNTDRNKKKSSLYTYILDENPEKATIVKFVSEKLCLSPFSSKISSLADSFKKSISGKLPTVEQWIQGFDSAEFVITDSFHGTIFSIIFNKPFIAIANKDRGLARFESLLEKVNLKHRLFSNFEEIPANFFEQEIDWTSVNECVKTEQNKSTHFLIGALYS